MSTSDANRLKEMEKENARLKRLVADLSLENAARTPGPLGLQTRLEVERQGYQAMQSRYRFPLFFACTQYF